MIREILAAETVLAVPALRELRPHFTDPDVLVKQIDELQRPQGYRLAAAFDDDAPDGTPASSVAGFRTGTNTAWGRFLYIDDLSTLPSARGRGHARAVLGWVLAEARRLGIDQVHLDSGVGPTRTDAHRLYFNTGFAIQSHHFGQAL